MVLQDNESLGLTVDAGHLVIDDARPDAECGSVQACFRRFGEVKSARAYDASGITSVLEPDRLIRPRRPVACGIFIGPTSALPKSGLARHRIFQPAAPVADAAFISGHKPASQAAGGLALRDEAETCAYTVWVDAHLDSPTVQLSHLLWSVLAWLSPAAPLGPLIAYEPMPWSSALSHRVRVLAGSLAESALLARVEAARPRDVLLSPPPLVVTSPAPWGSDVRVTATVSDAAVYIIERPDDAVSPALAAAASAVGWVRIGASGEVTVVADLLGLRIQRAAAAETTHAHLSAAVSNLTGSVPQAIAALPFSRPLLSDVDNGDLINRWAATVVFSLRWARIERVLVPTSADGSGLRYHPTHAVAIPSTMHLAVATTKALEARLGYDDIKVLLGALFTGFLSSPAAETETNNLEAAGARQPACNVPAEAAPPQPALPALSADDLCVNPSCASFEMTIVLPKVRVTLVNDLAGQDDELVRVVVSKLELNLANFHVGARSILTLALKVEAQFYNALRDEWEMLLERAAVAAEVVTPQWLRASAQTGPAPAAPLSRLAACAASLPMQIDDTSNVAHRFLTFGAAAERAVAHLFVQQGSRAGRLRASARSRLFALEDSLIAAATSAVTVMPGAEEAYDGIEDTVSIGTRDAHSRTSNQDYFYGRQNEPAGAVRAGHLPADMMVRATVGVLNFSVTSAAISALQLASAQYERHASIVRAAAVALGSLPRQQISASSRAPADALLGPQSRRRGYVYVANGLELDVGFKTRARRASLRSRAASSRERENSASSISSFASEASVASAEPLSLAPAASLLFFPVDHAATSRAGQLSGGLWSGIVVAGPILKYSRRKDSWQRAHAALFCPPPEAGEAPTLQTTTRAARLLFFKGSEPPTPQDPPPGFFEAFPEAKGAPPPWAQRACTRSIDNVSKLVDDDFAINPPRRRRRLSLSALPAASGIVEGVQRRDHALSVSAHQAHAVAAAPSAGAIVSQQVSDRFVFACLPTHYAFEVREEAGVAALFCVASQEDADMWRAAFRGINGAKVTDRETPALQCLNEAAQSLPSPQKHTRSILGGHHSTGSRAALEVEGCTYPAASATIELSHCP